MKLVNLIIIFSIFTCISWGQTKVYIPDMNLRKALMRYKAIEGDSLILEKMSQKSYLDLSGKNIKSLEGLEYCEKIRTLIVKKNELEDLNHLPPNLKSLYCSSNKIKNIDHLPKSLKNLYCENNQIKFIKGNFNDLNLLDCRNNQIKYIKGKFDVLRYLDCRNNQIKTFHPGPNLKTLNISNNKLKRLPNYSKLTFLNYKDNPIKACSIPDSLCEIEIINTFQNCIPQTKRKKPILGFKNLKHINRIDSISMGMTIWNYGHTGHSTNNYQINLIDSGEYFFSDYDLGKKKLKNRFVVHKKQIIETINDMVNMKFTFNLPYGDSTAYINLNHLPSGSKSCGVEVSHGSSYTLEIVLHSDQGTLHLPYKFSDDNSEDELICNYQNLQDINYIVDILYLRRLALCFPEHWSIKPFYTKRNLNQLIHWYKQL